MTINYETMTFREVGGVLLADIGLLIITTSEGSLFHDDNFSSLIVVEDY